MRKPAPEKTIAPCHRVRTRRGQPCREQVADGSRERRRHPLVRVDAQHPVVRRCADSELLLRAEAPPCGFDHPRAAAAGDLYGIIAAARIDDERFRGKRRGSKTRRELCAGVLRDHDE